MEQIGYSLVSADNIELKLFSDLPNPVRVSNGDVVYGADAGATFSDGTRLLPVMRDDNPPGEWYQKLRDVREVQSDQVLVTIIYADQPDFNAMRATMTVTPFQGRVALADANLLSQVQTAISAADQKTQLAWEYATEWRRNSPMIVTLAGALNLSDTQVDDLFRAAAQVTA